MNDEAVRPDLSGAAKALAQARDNLYSDPVAVVVHVQRLESLLGEAEGHPQCVESFEALRLAIERVESEGTGDVDFDTLSTAVDEVESAYEAVVSSIVAVEN